MWKKITGQQIEQLLIAKNQKILDENTNLNNENSLIVENRA